MSIVHSVAAWLLKKRIYQIEMFIDHPIDTQKEVFHRLRNAAENTDWGTKYGYKDIKNVREFQERVPLSTYEDLYPWIERLLQGEKNVVWPGKIRWFAKSSGTTNDKSKFIPISKESLNDCHFKGGKDMVAIYLHNNPNSKVFSGKALPIGGSHEINKLNGRSYYGDLSAVLIQNTPILFEPFRATSKKVALMSEWESKIQTMAEQLVKQNVTNIIGVPTWTLVLMHKIFEQQGITDNNILRVWKNLEVYFHGGVSFKPYRKQFEALIPSAKMNYFEIYNASEGIFGLQNESDKEDMLLMLDYGAFYEFIPMDELGKEKPKALTLEEVELGVTYALVISTNGGLWRYMIGDTIEFTSLHPFKIKIAGRTKHYINAFGEELMVGNAESALEKACEVTGALIENYTAAPIYFDGGANGAHEWIIEFKQEPGDLEQFREVLDGRLRELNSDYDAKRYKDMALRMLQLRSVPQGTFYNWMKSRGKLGGQNKVPRLSNTREYVDGILEILKPVS